MMRLAIVASFIAVLGSSAFAVTIAPLTDLELARMPVVVIAHWTGQRARAIQYFSNSIDANGRPYTATEYRFKISVDRVIHGDVAIGEHQVSAPGAQLWTPSGTPPKLLVSAGNHREFLVVQNVKEHNIWFLSKRKSSIPDENKTVLTMDSGNSIQSPVLERFYETLRGESRNHDIGALLSSPDELTVVRSIQYMIADFWQWRSGIYWGPELGPGTGFIPVVNDRAPLYEHAQAVAALIRDQRLEVRRTSLAAYAVLSKDRSVPELRQALGDPDEAVRAIALVSLATYHDAVAVKSMSRAASTIHDVAYVRSVITALDKWNAIAAAPVLIQFLQSGTDDDGGPPAAVAQKALRRITGVQFPLNVRRAMVAWDRASSVPPDKMHAVLERELRASSKPVLEARLSRNGTRTDIVIANVSKQTVRLPELPTNIDGRFQKIVWGYRPDDGGRKPRIIALAPGHTLRMRFKPVKEPTSPGLITLSYSTPPAPGDNSWFGELQIQIKR